MRKQLAIWQLGARAEGAPPAKPRGDRRTVESGRPLARVAGSRCALEKLQRERSTLDITGILFFVLAIGVVGAGLAVVTLRNVIHSAIAMMVCFGSLAGMYALLGLVG